MQQAEYHEFQGMQGTVIICHTPFAPKTYTARCWESQLKPAISKGTDVARGGHTIPPDLADRFMEVLLLAAGAELLGF